MRSQVDRLDVVLPFLERRHVRGLFGLRTTGGCLGRLPFCFRALLCRPRFSFRLRVGSLLLW